MNDTAVLILAAGEGGRWHDNQPKQLIDIWGEPLMARMVRQVNARGYRATVVTHDPTIAQAVEGEAAWFNPPARRWTVETLLSTQALWKERTVVLLGDVVYLKATMDAILTDDRPLSVFANTAEIFALSFATPSSIDVLAALQQVMRHAERSATTIGVGKLWNVFRYLSGFPLTSHRINFESLTSYLVAVKDWTFDMDSRSQYEIWVKRCVHEGLLDDLKPETV